MTGCMFDPAIFDPAIFDECVTPVTEEHHQGLIAPWVKQRALPGRLYPQPVVVAMLQGVQTPAALSISVKVIPHEEWLLLVA